MVACEAKWCSRGLPTDRVSLENGAIMMNSERWSAIPAVQHGNFWKSKFLYRYRPEGIFRIFFGLILDPHPPVHMPLQRKKGKFMCTGHFFPHGMAFLEKRGGLVPVYVFIFPELREKWRQVSEENQSRKCAINNFWTKNPRGLLGCGSRGGHVRLFMLGFSHYLKCIRDHQPS